MRALHPAQLPRALSSAQCSALLPARLLKQCWSKNTQFMRDVLLYDKQFLEFFYGLCSLLWQQRDKASVLEAAEWERIEKEGGSPETETMSYISEEFLPLELRIIELAQVGRLTLIPTSVLV